MTFPKGILQVHFPKLIDGVDHVDSSKSNANLKNTWECSWLRRLPGLAIGRIYHSFSYATVLRVVRIATTTMVPIKAQSQNLLFDSDDIHGSSYN